MTEYTWDHFALPSIQRRQIEAEFSDGDITSDGELLLQHIDKQ